ncbi:MAG TPA: DUF4861 family protein [Brevundimonas sp.]
MTDLSRRGVLGAALAGTGAVLPPASAIAQTRHAAPAPLPPPADPTPRAVVYFAPERFDDLMWENDRTAHRIYGHALQANEPPSGSGIDVWGKKVRWPYVNETRGYGNLITDPAFQTAQKRQGRTLMLGRKSDIRSDHCEQPDDMRCPTKLGLAELFLTAPPFVFRSADRNPR